MNMAQPSVAREPSMEEILASIRRIIESNEPGPTKSPETAFSKSFESDAYDDEPVDAAEEIHLTIDDSLPQFIEVADALRPAPDAVTAPRSAAPVASGPRISQPVPEEPVVRRGVAETRTGDEPRSISLADVAARVRAASERGPSEPPVASRPVAEARSTRTVELSAPPQPVRMPQPVVRVASSVQPPKLQQDVFRASDHAGTPDINVLEMAFAPPVGPELDTFGEARQDTAPVRPEDQADDNRALVSTSTGDQVARSFHELAELVNSTAQRTLDEVAEDLLRPMLQEWLDDNLPTLVERLVREEIERVARGPRR